MSTPPRIPGPPRLLLTVTVVLAVTGTILLAQPGGRGTAAPPGGASSPAASAPPATSTVASPSAARTVSSSTAGAAARTAAAATGAAAVPASPTTSAAASTSAPVLPPHGEGTAGDHAIQAALETAWPADLPARDAQQLLDQGRALLRADATGMGRERWPAVFPDVGRGLAPAFARAGFRLQAAIARRDGAGDRAVVHLVWAGCDRAGTCTDGRITDWHFTRTSQKGASAWIPQPPA
ncbi:hypothetical protein [Streptomyces sp. NPDC054834]